MSDKPRLHNQKIDPLDPHFDKPRKSKRYSRMYEDWEFYRVASSEARKGYKTVGVYKGVYYKVDQDKSTKIRHRIAFSAGLLLIMFLFICCCLLPYSYNTIWYVGIAEFLTFVSLVYVVVTMLIYLTAEENMTVYTYRITSLNLINVCTAAAILLGVCTLTTVLSFLIASQDNTLFDYVGALGFAACSVGMFFLQKTEKALPYKKWLSKDTFEKNVEKLGIQK